MIIDIERLPEDGLQVCKDFEFYSVELVEEKAVFIEPVRTQVTVKKIGEEIFIKGSMTTRLSFICCRCLSPFEFQVESDFNLVYLSEELELAQEQLYLNDMNKAYYYNQQIDLKEIILEQLNFTFPMRPMCTEDCQGICPVCGRVNKKGKCSCLVDESDVRLEKFKLFLRDKD